MLELFDLRYMREALLVNFKTVLGEKSPITKRQAKLVEKINKELEALGYTDEDYQRFCEDHYTEYIDDELTAQARNKCYHYKKAVQKVLDNSNPEEVAEKFPELLKKERLCNRQEKCSFMCPHFRKVTEKEEDNYIMGFDIDDNS